MPRYNQYNRNRMSLNTVDFQPTVFTPIEFRPVEQDYSILERAMAKQEERKEKALAQQANIEAAISQVELDASEDQWKQDYINNINNQIEQAAAVGDYAGAYETAVRLARKSASDPALRGRERYNQERKKYLDELRAKKDKDLISQDAYERAIATNTYNYRDIYDDKGNIVAGSSWEAEYDPRNRMDMSKVLAEMQAFMGVSSETIGGGGGAKQIFNYNYVGADGKQYTGTTTDPNHKGIVSIKGVQKGGSSTESTKEITAQDWKEAFNAYLARHPEQEADFYQMWEDSWWMYNNLKEQINNNQNLSPEQRASLQQSVNSRRDSLTDKDNVFLTKDEWILKQISPSFDVMSYKQHSKVSEASETLIDKETLRNQTIANIAFGGNAAAVELWTAGAPQELWANYVTETVNGVGDLNNNLMNFINNKLNN